MTTFAMSCKDFYKTDHKSQYPDFSEQVYSNGTPRSDRLSPIPSTLAKELGVDGKVVWFGLQAFQIDFLINEYKDTFFNVPKRQAVRRYKRRLDNSVGKDAVDVSHVEALHDLGYLPIEIRSLPEGSLVNIKVPCFTIHNTLEDYYWLVNDLETVMSSEVWKPSTSATIAFAYRKLIQKFAVETGAPLDFVPIQGHDFSFRGMSGRHDAAMTGMGHLLSFIGTDTIPAIDAAEDFYFADSDKELIGISVPATEHSVMCMGTQESEVETFRRLIEDIYPVGIVSIVSDTWDYWKVLTEYTVELFDKIKARKPITDEDGNVLVPGRTVFRPDSGCPVKIITGYKVFDKYTFDSVDKALEHATDFPQDTYDYEAYKLANGTYVSLETEKLLTDAEVKGSVQVLWDIFGGTRTDEGYRMLDDSVGLIYGDSITLERANAILTRLKDKGFASSNIVFGIGSYTYQYVTRDSFGWAVKATAGVVAGEVRELMKDPATDDGTKKSAKGYLRVEKEGDDFVLYDCQTWEQAQQGELQVVFRNGELVNPSTFGEIRERLAANL